MTNSTYNPAAIVFHWVTALAVIGLFSLGLWMDGLSYYDAWYQKAPNIHRSLGILLAILIIARLLCRRLAKTPPPLPNHKSWERVSAKVTHWLLYGLLVLIVFSGYLISTAKGQPIEVFNWFSVPAMEALNQKIPVENLEDVSGEIHEILAFTLIGITILHAGAALKHHFIDHDRTLMRMFGK
jgi:cytochrome b561